MDALAQCFQASCLDRRQAVAQHRCEDVDHLAIAISGASKLAAHTLESGGQDPVLERRTVPQRARLAGQNRHIVPGIEHRLVAPEATAVIADDPTVLTQLDPIGIGADLHRPPDRMCRHRVFVLVELNQTGL